MGMNKWLIWPMVAMGCVGTAEEYGVEHPLAEEGVCFEEANLSPCGARLVGEPTDLPPDDCSPIGTGDYCGCLSICSGHINFSDPVGITELGCDVGWPDDCTTLKYYEGPLPPPNDPPGLPPIEKIEIEMEKVERA